jgi:hypothetical protein
LLEVQKEFYENENGKFSVVTLVPKQEFDDCGMLENNFIVLTKQTLDIFLKHEKPSELIALYVFYYYTAKWQKTNIIKCTTGYASKGLRWKRDKVIKNKKELIKLGLITDFQRRNDTGQITGHYIKMGYVLKNETVREYTQPTPKPEGGFYHRVEKGDINALSTNNINALNTNNINALDKQNTLSKQIDYVYYNYPSKCSISGRSTHKSYKDKDKIGKLIKKVGFSELLDLQKKYIYVSKKQNTWIKNYSTFLNNLPDYTYFSDPIAQEKKAKEIQEALSEKN